jgi:RNA polymerase sigma-70 factor (ECF subfamily)
MLRAMVRNSEDAEDLVQETFVRAYRFLHRFDQTRPFGPWLLRIGSNLARNHLRRARRTATLSLDEGPAGGDEDGYEGEWLADHRSLEELAHRDLLAATRAALERLEPDQRVVLEMRLIGEMSYKEIAEALGIPIGTVMSRLSRGRGQLQAELRIEDPRRARAGEAAASDPTAGEAP